MVAETGRDFGTTLRHDWAIFQCRWQARFDAHLSRLQGHRRQPIARSGKFVRRACSRRALECAYCRFHLTLPLREASPQTRAARSLKMETLMRDCVVKDLTATGAKLARLGLAWPAVTCHSARLGRVGLRRFSPGLYDLRVNCLANHFLSNSTLDPPMASWFSSCLYGCRWFNKKCCSILPNTFAGTACRGPPGPVGEDVSAKIRHGASTTCLRLNLSPHYLADQCFYFKRSRGPGLRRGFAQGQS